MSIGVRRVLADLACRTLQAALPDALHAWGWAIRCELEEISDGTEALLFALDSLFGLLPRLLASHLLQSFAPHTSDAFHLGGPIAMTRHDSMLPPPRTLGIACMAGAVALGLGYLTIAGAPIRYLAVNTGALVIGLTLLALLGRINSGAVGMRAATVAMAGALLATALFGDPVEGAARWMIVGGLVAQPSLILLPAMLTTFARTRDAIATGAMIAAAVALALQPDRAMAGMLALGLAALTIVRSDRHVVAALLASVAALAATLVQADTLPAVPYVDGVLYSAFEIHVAAGIAVLGGSTLLLVPAVVGWLRAPADRATYAVLAAIWIAAIVAAALGNYPTPIVGYGGSAIIGYALSLLGLPKRARGATEVVFRPGATVDTTPRDRHLRARLA